MCRFRWQSDSCIQQRGRIPYYCYCILYCVFLVPHFEQGYTYY